MVVVFGAVVVCVVVVTGGVGPVFVDFTVVEVVDFVAVVVVVTGATRATGAVVVTTGAAVVVGAAAVVGALWWTTAFLWWAFLWCTARLCGAAATEEVALDVVDVLEEPAVLEPVVPAELPQPATTTLAPMTASSADFIRPTPVIALACVIEANNG